MDEFGRRVLGVVPSERVRLRKLEPPIATGRGRGSRPSSGSSKKLTLAKPFHFLLL